MRAWGRTRPTGMSAIALMVSLLVAAGTGGAATITGTPGNDSLRGSARADKLSGLGGNDKLHGLAGNDVLTGGLGNDLLVGGTGADVLSCGPGRDTARADARDKVRNCEIVTGTASAPPLPPAPPPPAPTPPPPPPPVVNVTPGQYQGQINQGNFLYFEIRGDRTVVSWRTNEIPEECANGGILRGGFWAVYPTPAPIDNDGNFVIDWTGSVDVEDFEGPARFHVRISGRVVGSFASGTVESSSEFKFEGEQYSCASGRLLWNATRIG